MRTKSKYYDDDDPNNPSHPEFDGNVWQRATPKRIYDITVTFNGQPAYEFPEAYRDMAQSLYQGGVDIHEINVVASLEGYVWGVPKCSGEEYASFKIDCHGRWEDIEPHLEIWPDKYGCDVKCVEQESDAPKFVTEPFKRSAAKT